MNSPGPSEEKIVSTHLLRFSNGHYLSFTNAEGLTRASFRPGELIDESAGSYPESYPYRGNPNFEMEENDPNFYDEDCPDQSDYLEKELGFDG